MKRSDLKVDTIFRRKSDSRTWYKIRGGSLSMQVWSYRTPECTEAVDFEGYLRETESHKGFTLEAYIINKQVAAFFPFNEFEVINQ